MGKTKLINIRIDEVLLNQFNDYCTDNNTNKSEFLINAIKQALSSNQSVNNTVNTTIDYNVNTDVKTDSKPFDIKEIETVNSLVSLNVNNNLNIYFSEQIMNNGQIYFTFNKFNIKMKTFKDISFSPHTTGSGLMGRVQFDNGYGVSVVRFKISGSYGSCTNNENEWELAVLKNNKLCYDTYITDDVMGHLSENEVTDIMKKIQDLPKATPKKEWKLVDKHGEYHYKTGTKYEVANYAVENQLLMVVEGEQ
jgi:hypothetical protein